MHGMQSPCVLHYIALGQENHKGNMEVFNFYIPGPDNAPGDVKARQDQQDIARRIVKVQLRQLVESALFGQIWFPRCLLLMQSCLA